MKLTIREQLRLIRMGIIGARTDVFNDPETEAVARQEASEGLDAAGWIVDRVYELVDSVSLPDRGQRHSISEAVSSTSRVARRAPGRAKPTRRKADAEREAKAHMEQMG